MILVIDNYDSFTYNLVHYIAEMGGEPVVRRNDAMSAAEALALGADAIVLSPGPCTPNEAGICLELLAQAPDDLPILGVCLGHQAIGQAFGGEVVQAREIMHGRTSRIHHENRGLFEGLPQDFEATRYHSLAIAPETCPAVLRIDARTPDGEIMGVAHASRPIYGLQFHPESIASEHGHALIAAFLKVARP